MNTCYVRPVSSVLSTPLVQPAQFNVVPFNARSIQTSVINRDIDSAAKFIGAGAATVGVAGSGMRNDSRSILLCLRTYNVSPFLLQAPVSDPCSAP